MKKILMAAGAGLCLIGASMAGVRTSNLNIAHNGNDTDTTKKVAMLMDTVPDTSKKVAFSRYDTVPDTSKKFAYIKYDTVPDTSRKIALQHFQNINLNDTVPDTVKKMTLIAMR